MNRKQRRSAEKKQGNASMTASPLQALFSQAVRHHQAGQLQEAEKLYRQILAADPVHADSLHLLGVIASQVKAYDTAVQLISRAISLKDSDPLYHCHLGIALKNQGKLDAAIASYERALALDPNHADAHYNRGTALRNHGRLDEAMAAFKRTLTLKPGHIEALLNLGHTFQEAGQSDAAVATYDQVLKLRPDHVDGHYNRGNALRQQGKLDEAAASYRRALALRADSPEIHNNLAVTLAAQGANDLAAASYERALALRPAYAEAHNNLGNALQRLGRTAEAAASYERALALRPDYADAHVNLGAVLYAQGKVVPALASYERALAVRPDFVEAHNNRGIAFQQQGKLEEAAASYERALALRPNYAEAHLNLGVTRNEQGRPQEAVASYDRALLLRPDYVEAQYNRGNALKSLGKLREAVDCYRKVVGVRPNHWEAFNNMGSALVGLDPGEAEASIRRALDLSPNNTTVLSNLASISNAQGRPLEGLRFVEQALRISETPEARSIFVSCVSRASLPRDDRSPDRRALRLLVARALGEAWGRPSDLAPVAIELLKADPLPLEAAVPGPLDPAASGEPGSDPLMRALLQSTPVCDVELERYLTTARRALLEKASSQTEPDDGGVPQLGFFAALASQCFINEYVFSTSADEAASAGALREKLEQVLEAGRKPWPSWVVAVASYFPLLGLANARRLLETPWPAEIEAVLEQQISEPLEELEIRASIPTLTALDDEVSIQVKSQYEENPYPRWIKVPLADRAKDIEGHFRATFPLAPIRPHQRRATTDILICGCGTGQHPIDTASRFGEAQVLAIDLSMSSLSYAKRKTRELGLASITYAQADLLRLDTLGRQFDVIEAAGVLHHLSNPWVGGQIVASLLRPGGFMKLGLYSEVARRHVVEVRAFIEHQGYDATSADIRRFRDTLMNAAENEGLIRLLGSDFFSVSGCRDLLFHVQEHRMTLTDVEGFLRANGLTLLGFDIEPAVLRSYRQRFPDDAPATDLARWQIFENENPRTFLGMYQFWVQKAA